MEDQAEKLREIMRQRSIGSNKDDVDSRGIASTGGDGFRGDTVSAEATFPRETPSLKGNPGDGNEKYPRAEPAAESGPSRAAGRGSPPEPAAETRQGRGSPPEDFRHRGKGKTRIITITSGKGGVGKTNVAVNMALSYARLGKKVIVMDADLGLANVNIMLNMVPRYTLYDMIRKRKTMREIMVETDYGISIVAGASGFSKVANLSDEERQNFIEELNTLSFADIIIIDTSAGVSSNVLDFIAAADDAIIITTPEPTAITDAYGIIKIIATEYDNLDMELKLVVNRVKGAAEAKKVADRMTHIAGQFLNLKVDYLGFIYDDPVVSQAVLRQKPFTVIDPRCKASICVQHIVGKMEKSELRETGGFASMIKRLFGKKQGV